MTEYLAPVVHRILRLRPVVHASRTATGLALRGWTGIVTIDGPPALWRLWQTLQPRLRDGIDTTDLEGPGAVRSIVEQLRNNDLLVDLPSDWDARIEHNEGPPPDIARWLESHAADPLDAWRRLTATPIHVQGRGEVAASAVRALRRAGASIVAESVVDAGGPSWAIISSPDLYGVRAEADSIVGLVTPVLRTHDLPFVTEELRARLAGSPDAPAPVVAALVGGVAAHRMVSARAGLADPAVQAPLIDGSERSNLPQVFVARPDPWSAGFHSWAAGASAPPDSAPSKSVRHLLDRSAALWDAELGVLPGPEPGALPQVPLGMATCGDVSGVGLTTDVARLDALLRAADVRLDTSDAVARSGGSRLHANGRALRELLRRHSDRLAGPELAQPSQFLAGSAAGRRWWKTLTLRLGIAADLRVRRIGPQLTLAQVYDGQSELGWAIESDPPTAALVATIAGVGHVQAGHRVEMTTAVNHLQPRATDDPGWFTGDDTLPESATSEDVIQRRILRRLELIGTPMNPTGAVSRQGFARALEAVGLSVSIWRLEPFQDKP